VTELCQSNFGGIVGKLVSEYETREVLSGIAWVVGGALQIGIRVGWGVLQIGIRAQFSTLSLDGLS
jgi:hypothetical protein